MRRFTKIAVATMAAGAATFALGVTPATAATPTGVVYVTPYTQAKYYGTPDPAFSYTNTGFKTGDTFVTRPTCGVTADHTHAGTYAITCSGGVAPPQYRIVYLTNTLFVLRAKSALLVQPVEIRKGPGPLIPPTPVRPLAAQLSRLPGNAPLAGQTVSFFAGTTPECTAVTDASGVATCIAGAPPAALLVAGSVTAVYAGNADVDGTSGSATIYQTG